MDLTGLSIDGDTLELPDGRTLTLHIESDLDCSVNDYECYGRVEWTRNNDYGPVRPDGFTGRAQIMDRDRGSCLWWEPYEELTEEQIRKERAEMAELLRYGFSLVGLELSARCPECGVSHTVETEWLGGVDDVGSKHLAEILSDMVSELGVE